MIELQTIKFTLCTIILRLASNNTMTNLENKGFMYPFHPPPPLSLHPWPVVVVALGSALPSAWPPTAALPQVTEHQLLPPTRGEERRTERSDVQISGQLTTVLALIRAIS